MNIRNNIINYLCDNDYVISIYDNFLYIYKYSYLGGFNDKIIDIKVKNRIITVKGQELSITKITKEEILIKGTIKSLEMMMLNEQN